MSEDKTQDIPAHYETKPTLETILEEVRGVRAEQHAFRVEMLEFRERTESRLDRIESMALETRADVRDLKRLFREFLSRQKEVA